MLCGLGHLAGSVVLGLVGISLGAGLASLEWLEGIRGNLAAWLMIGFGLVGITMNRLRIPLAPFVIGFVLAPLAEENLSAGLMASGGSWLPLVTRPFSIICLLVAAILAVIPIWRRRCERERASHD